MIGGRGEEVERQNHTQKARNKNTTMRILSLSAPSLSPPEHSSAETNKLEGGPLFAFMFLR